MHFSGVLGLLVFLLTHSQEHSLGQVQLFPSVTLHSLFPPFTDAHFQEGSGNDKLSRRSFFCCMMMICFCNVSREVICSSLSCVSFTSSFCSLSQYFCNVIASELHSSICLFSWLISISSGPSSCPCTRAKFGINQAEADFYSIWTFQSLQRMCHRTPFPMGIHPLPGTDLRVIPIGPTLKQLKSHCLPHSPLLKVCRFFQQDPPYSLMPCDIFISCRHVPAGICGRHTLISQFPSLHYELINTNTCIYQCRF